MVRGTAIFALALLCTAGTASAQSQAPTTGPLVANVLLGLGQSRAGTSFDTLGSVGFKVTPNVQIGGELGTMDFKQFRKTTDVLPETHQALRYGGQVLLTYAREMTVKPFLTTGVGSIRTDSEDGSDKTNLGYFNIGVGFDFWTPKYVGVGMMYRAYFAGEGTIHYFNVGARVGLH